MTITTKIVSLCSIYPKHFPVLSSFLTYHWIVTRLTRRVPLVEQGQVTLQEHLGSHPVFSGARVTRSLVLCVSFVGCCSSLCTFSFGHCVVCPSSICAFLFSLWYLQTLFLIPFMLRCTRYNIMWSSLSVTDDRSVNFSGYSCVLHQS